MIETNPLPISVLIPTADRPDALETCLGTLARQSRSAAEIIVVDASVGEETARLCDGSAVQRAPVVRVPAARRGAAAQRTIGLGRTSYPYVLFMDDDVELEDDCVARLWAAMHSDPSIGGVGSMLVNQNYSVPGRVSRFVYRVVGEATAETAPGRCLGPVVTVFPADWSHLPEIVPVEWLNTTCTMYRREALPTPLFPEHFVGYSLGEDVHLSLTVGRKWKLVNARTARVLHRSRSGPHKPDRREMARMALVNRHYIMTRALLRTAPRDYANMALVEAVDLAAAFGSFTSFKQLPAVVAGKIHGLVDILSRH